MNYIKLFILTIFTAFMVTACVKQSTVVGKGDVESMAVTTPAFTTDISRVGNVTGVDM